MLNISVDPQAIIKFMLINTRISTFILLLPIFSIIQLPIRVRVLFAFMLAFALAPTIAAPSAYLGDANLLLYFIYEVLIGSTMAFGILAAFAAFQLGGRFLDLQMGFGVAALIDPATRQQSALIGSVLGLWGTCIFVFEGGHRLALKALHHSFSQLPIAELNSIAIDPIVTQFALMFSFAAMLVLPVLILLMMLDIIMAVAARTMPQLNIFILSIPVKIFIGIVMLSVTVRVSTLLLHKIYASIFTYWEVL